MLCTVVITALLGFRAFNFLSFGFKYLTYKPQPTPQNKRVSKANRLNVVRKQTGALIAEIPAYVRKSQGYCYPLTSEIVDKITFTVVDRTK